MATGWWYTYPSEKYEFVSWDDDTPNIWKVIKFHGSKPPTRLLFFFVARFRIGKPSINGPFSMAMLNNQAISLSGG